MAPLVLEGGTLGERHRHYNKLVKEAIVDKPSKLEELNFEEPDVTNLLKIDVASYRRDLEYILNVLKCEDMLYVSKAIKQCPWLITDNQYAYIINPDYLHTQLFPYMTTKAINKLSLHIRVNLKDEKRVADFYNYYYKETDKNNAFKWLPHCSLKFVESVVQKHAYEINNNLIKRLCEKSINILDVFVRNYNYWKKKTLDETVFVMYNNTEKYLDILDALQSSNEYPTLKKKPTETILTNNKQRVLDNFEKYSDSIDLETLAKHLKPEEIKGFLLKHVKNEKLKHWYKYEKLKYFFKYMPKEGRFEFLREMFIDQIHEESSINTEGEYSRDYEGAICLSSCSSSNISILVYMFAPFNTAFVDLKKLIRAGSSGDERNAMLSILLTCCKRNLQHVQTLLQYYHDNHINESFKFKIKFINNIIKRTDTYKYDEKTWNTLNVLFHSAEVYDEYSEKNVQSCIQTVIIYKILRDENIPEIIQKKFIFSTLTEYEKRLNPHEKSKIFSYLFSHLKVKINNDVQNEKEFKGSLESLKCMLELLSGWNKQLADYPWIVSKIKDYIRVSKEKSWHANAELSSIYNVKKSWRRFMFEESLLICPTEEVCINILKHDPNLFSKYYKEIEDMRSNNTLSLIRLLSKLRIYWTNTLATEWTDIYRKKLNQLGSHKALVRGLCVLLTRQQLLDFIKTYESNELKINWNESDELIFSLRKHIAANMYFGRPQVQPEVVLSYAKGDYLQYALSSLIPIHSNLSVAATRIIIPKLLNSPVSVQKYGIRIAFWKLKTEELKQVFSEMWKSTKNYSIRAELFNHTFKLMCRENNPSVIESIWEILDIFIDNLTPDDNKSININLSKIKKIPDCVKGKCFMKSYSHLKSLPKKCNCKHIISVLLNNAPQVMDLLDPDFVENNLLLDFMQNKFSNKKNVGNFMTILSSYLLCSKDENTQNRKEMFLIYIIERTVSLWNAGEKVNYIRHNFEELLNEICSNFEDYILEKKMLFPIKLCTTLQETMEKALPVEENYVMLRKWKIFTALVKALEKHKSVLDKTQTKESYRSSFNKWNEIYSKATPEFGEACAQYLLEDAKSYHSSVYLLLYSEALNQLFQRRLYLNFLGILRILNSMLTYTNVDTCCLTVIKIMNDQNSIPTEKEEIDIWKEICSKILSNESSEVKIHFLNSKVKREYELNTECDG